MRKNLTDTEKQRLIIAINFLKEQKIAKSISQICEICGVNPGYLRDIKAKNANFSQEFIEKLYANFPINEQYVLTGDGEILLSAGGCNIAHTGNVNNAAGGVQNVSNNCGHVVNETTLQPEPSGQSFAEVLQQLVATNAKLVETNAKLVEMLNK